MAGEEISDAAVVARRCRLFPAFPDQIEGIVEITARLHLGQTLAQRPGDLVIPGGPELGRGEFRLHGVLDGVAVVMGIDDACGERVQGFERPAIGLVAPVARVRKGLGKIAEPA